MVVWKFPDIIYKKKLIYRNLFCSNVAGGRFRTNIKKPGLSVSPSIFAFSAALKDRIHKFFEQHVDFLLSLPQSYFSIVNH